MISTRQSHTVDLGEVCAFYMWIYRNPKDADQQTLKWADENNYPVPDDIRNAIFERYKTNH